MTPVQASQHVCLLVVLAVLLCHSPSHAYDWKWKQGRATYYDEWQSIEQLATGIAQGRYQDPAVNPTHAYVCRY
jgi:hypothetical protein